MDDLFAPPTLKQGDRLPSFTHVARNTSTGGNMVHNDEVARQHGFSGGLVPGVTTYAYWASDMARALGPLWLFSGQSTISLRRPVYEGEEVVSGGEVLVTQDQQMATLTVAGGIDGPDGTRRAPATALVEWPLERKYVIVRVGPPLTPMERSQAKTLVPSDTPPRSPEDRLRAVEQVVERRHARSAASPRQPHERQPISLATAPLWEPLPPVEIDTSAEAMAAYLDAIGDDNPLFREPTYEGQPLVHPGLWATAANRVLDRNFQLPLWVHTKSEIQHRGLAPAGGVYRAYGKLTDAFERNGHEYVTASVDVVNPDGRDIAHLTHTAIVVLASAKG